MIRTRYAPSPTGSMHIGNLRAALYEYLIAKHSGGIFILRIEDTDQGRYVEGAMDIIFETLRVAGLKYDEGPGVGGDYGPYIQSERKDHYLPHAKQLVNNGKAYYCFCVKGERSEVNEKNEKYDRRCAKLSADEVTTRLEAGEPFVVRQLIPPGKTTFHDEVFGDITIDHDEIEDQILIKSDAMPTYNFANVVDDHTMAITHVVRGSEYLTSTPKYKLLYEAFGWDVPIYVHLPLLVNEDGAKLSKRHGDASFNDLLDQGFLPEAIVNYIALLGWSPEDNQEFFTLKELVESFSISRLSKSPSVFDVQKLRWMNAEYFKRMEPSRFYEMAKPIIDKALMHHAFDTRKLAAAVQSRITFLSDIPEMLDFLPGLPTFDTELYVNKKQKCDRDTALVALSKARDVLAAIPADAWHNDNLYTALQDLAAKESLKNSQILWPVRIALSGKATTPVGATETLELFGKEESLSRLEKGIAGLVRSKD